MRTIRETDTYVMARFITERQLGVRINKAYFPGWIYKVNSQVVRPTISRGLPEITIPEAESTLEIEFTDTPVRKVGNLVSLATALYLLWHYGKSKKTHA